MKEKLYNASIHDLRIYARQIGVKAPTQLKKAELIEEIFKIQEGIIKPICSKKGRPIIKRNNIENCNYFSKNILIQISAILDNAKNEIMDLLNSAK